MEYKWNVIWPKSRPHTQNVCVRFLCRILEAMNKQSQINILNINRCSGERMFRFVCIKSLFISRWPKKKTTTTTTAAVWLSTEGLLFIVYCLTFDFFLLLVVVVVRCKWLRVVLWTRVSSFILPVEILRCAICSCCVCVYVRFPYQSSFPNWNKRWMPAIALHGVWRVGEIMR